MQWKLDDTGKAYLSECCNYKIMNSRKEKGGSCYGVFTLANWSCQGEGYRDFVRLVKVGTLDECLKYGG